MIRMIAISCTIVLVAAACGDTATTTSDATGTTAAPATTVAPTTTPATTLPPATTSTTTTTEPATTTTAGPIGEPFDFWVPTPAEGPILGVIGVQYDDTLNVRSGPGITFDVIATLDPTLMGISGTGNGWQLPSGTVWWEIDAGGGIGWANQRFLSRFAGVDDITSLVVASLGEIPLAETMLELGTIVANAVASTDVESGIVVVVAPTVGDLGEITIDVLGLADDSQEGWRLHIFGQPTESG
ncbi:MAG: hypothetical protein OES13_00190, partial [Acidimicrobiia bacterium]|nr:hypothetical protein [Acidimicrobiia bacterium]